MLAAGEWVIPAFEPCQSRFACQACWCARICQPGQTFGLYGGCCIARMVAVQVVQDTGGWLC